MLKWSLFEVTFCPNQLQNLQVAIKKMKKKYYSWEECVNLREVKVLLHTYLSGAFVVVMCYYILLSDLLFPLLAVFTKNESPKYCETEGSYSRKRHFVLCF